jgi:Cd2+/Zn2+-exporting ATPase
MAISRAAKRGIVVKGAAVMERLKDIKIFVTDKTGTLTKGIAKVVSVIPLNGFSEEEILSGAGTASSDSKHPTSRAILKYISENYKNEIHAPDEAKEVPGEGMWARHGKDEYMQGRASFLEESGVHISDEVKNKISEIQTNGESVSFISINKKAAGIFVLEDEVRSHAKEVIAETRLMGVKNWIMLTGDNPQVAERVSKAVGIDEFHAELKPEGKIEYLKKIKHRHGEVAMIGDGVNDAAALAMADVSFAMGTIGTDASIEAADIAIMHDDFKRVPEAIFLSRHTISIVKQNFIIWALTNSFGLFLAIGGFVGPVGASVFNFATDFFPILNVFRIYSVKKK